MLRVPMCIRMPPPLPPHSDSDTSETPLGRPGEMRRISFSWCPGGLQSSFSNLPPCKLLAALAACHSAFPMFRCTCYWRRLPPATAHFQLAAAQATAGCWQHLQPATTLFQPAAMQAAWAALGRVWVGWLPVNASESECPPLPHSDPHQNRSF